VNWIALGGFWRLTRGVGHPPRLDAPGPPSVVARSDVRVLTRNRERRSFHREIRLPVLIFEEPEARYDLVADARRHRKISRMRLRRS
jgi:hypothetical protein